MTRLPIAVGVPLLVLLAACGSAEKDGYNPELMCPRIGAAAFCPPWPPSDRGRLLEFETTAPGEAVERVLEMVSRVDETVDISEWALASPPFFTDVTVGDTLGPREQRNVTFRFAPEAAGNYEQWIGLPSDSGSMRLIGTAIIPTPPRCDTTTLRIGPLEPYSTDTVALRCTNDNPMDRLLRGRLSEDSTDFSVEGPLGGEAGLLVPPDVEIVIPVRFEGWSSPGSYQAVLLLELQGAEALEIEVRACVLGSMGEGCDDTVAD